MTWMISFDTAHINLNDGVEGERLPQCKMGAALLDYAAMKSGQYLVSF